MGDLIGNLMQFFVELWGADSQIRDQSILGESELERSSRRFVDWLWRCSFSFSSCRFSLVVVH
jgi:hypothetical protein